jgi:hypothetical protein
MPDRGRADELYAFVPLGAAVEVVEELLAAAGCAAHAERVVAALVRPGGVPVE